MAIAIALGGVLSVLLEVLLLSMYSCIIKRAQSEKVHVNNKQQQQQQQQQLSKGLSFYSSISTSLELLIVELVDAVSVVPTSD